MLRRAARSLAPRVSALASHVEGAEAAACCSTVRQFTSSPPASGIHIEEEVYNRQRQLINLQNRVVTVSPDTWVAPSAVVVGDVDLYEQVSVWNNAVLRGDLNSIKVGAFSTIGDRTVIHAARSSPTGLPAATVVGRSVTVGKGCVLRSATVEDECVVGDKCVLLEGSLMEKQSVLGAGSVLPPGRRVPAGQLWAGNPARYVRDLTKDEKAGLASLAAAAAPAADAAAAQFLPDSSAYRQAEALRAAMKPEAALVQGADLEAVTKDVEEAAAP